MKRARRVSTGESVTPDPGQSTRGGVPGQAVLPSATVEGVGRPSVNAASPQGRRTLHFTLNSTPGSQRIASAYQQRVEALPQRPVTVSIPVDRLPKYVPPSAARKSEPPIPAAPAHPKVPGVVMSENAFACWRRKEPAPIDEQSVDFAEAAARSVRAGMDAWLEARLKLKDDRRIRFLIESLPHVIEAHWGMAVALIFREAPLERLQGSVWSGQFRLAHLVLRFGDKELIRSVLGQEAVKGALAERDRDGMTPLHLAVTANDAETTAKILDFQDLADNLVLMPNREKWTPIHLAARAGADRAGCNLLLRQPHKQRRIVNKINQRAIHIAAIHARASFVKLLLAEDAQDQLCARDDTGKNALMHAVRWGTSAVVRELLAVHSALCAQLAQYDAEERNALWHAQAAGNPEVLGLIAGAMRRAFPENEPAPSRPTPKPSAAEDGANTGKRHE